MTTNKLYEMIINFEYIKVEQLDFAHKIKKKSEIALN